MSRKIPPSLKRLWADWLRPLAISAAIVFPIKSSLGDWNWIPTGSMKPTMLEGDMVFVNKLAYDFKIPFTQIHLAEWADPQKGDIVVFPSPQNGMRFVKRVVAVPGDQIAMKDNVLFINGTPQNYVTRAADPYRRELYEDRHPVLARESGALPEHWVMALPSRQALRSFASVTVPPGKYFMMGDSRDNSHDSRFFGFVDRAKILGRTEHVVLSFDKNHYYAPRFSRFFSRLDS